MSAKRTISLLAVALMACLGAVAVTAAADPAGAAPPTSPMLISAYPFGQQQTIGDPGNLTAVSDSGRFVAYASNDLDLDPNQHPSQGPVIYLRDTTTSTSRLISLGADNTPVPGAVFSFVLSGDGSTLAFLWSGASGFIVDVRNLSTGATSEVPNAGQQFSISDDGSRFAFGDLDPSSGRQYLLNRATGIVTDLPTGQAPVISADGQHVVYQSFGGPSEEIYEYNVSTGTSTLVSVDQQGHPATGNLGGTVAVSSDGRYVSFVANVSLTSGDPTTCDNGCLLVYRRDVTGGVIQRVDVPMPSAVVSPDCSNEPFTVMSGDGSIVGFFSTCDLTDVPLNGIPQVYLHDFATGRTSVGSVDGYQTPSGQQADEDGISLSSDGSTLVFGTAADLANTGTPPTPQVQVYAASVAAVTAVSTGAATTLTLTSDMATPTVVSQVTFTAEVHVTGGGPAPTGTVRFTDNGAGLCLSAALSTTAPYIATCTTDPPNQVGNETENISAAYSGDGAAAGSHAFLSYVVGFSEPSALGVAINPTAPKSGQPVTITATVTGDGTTTPLGTVTFLVDGDQVGDNTDLVDGVATSVSITGLTQTTHTWEVDYNGDNLYDPQSDSGTFAVVAAPPPAPPTNVSATAGVTSALVSWTASTDSGVTGYSVTSTDISDPQASQAVNTGAGATTAAFSTLVAGDVYTFTVTTVEGTKRSAGATSNQIVPTAVAEGATTSSSSTTNDGTTPPITVPSTGGTQASGGATGIGTMTMGAYTAPPVTPLDGSASYFDVDVSPGASFTSVTVSFCPATAATVIQWYDPVAGAWTPVSNVSGPSGSPPCDTITIGPDTSPSLSQLYGTVFALAAPAPSITTTSLPTATQNAAYSTQLAASGGIGTLTYSATGLPSGLSISSTGLVSGTPTGSGSGPVGVTVTDGNGAIGTATLNLTVNPAAVVPPATKPTLFVSPVAAALVGYRTSIGIMVAGETSPVLSTSKLPAGLTLTQSGSKGTISGTPTTSGTTTITVTAKGKNNTSVSKTVTLTVYAAPSFTSATSFHGTKGVQKFTVTATGLPTPMLLVTSRLPSWLHVSRSAGTLVFSGTEPKGIKAFRITVVAINAFGAKAQTITVSP